ncbi:hypothetical protein RHRU231_880095 [Rhodococcus ruber]|uniref:Uncharacterized protein n=1 Tax=Rhodococcus ruber TaxID=1830 RepID=A0A098BT36_9NOCA|nr:hypothetical protein RHRU231_880095 [Rhodococcus ruber]
MMGVVARAAVEMTPHHLPIAAEASHILGQVTEPS